MLRKTNNLWKFLAKVTQFSTSSVSERCLVHLSPRINPECFQEIFQECQREELGNGGNWNTPSDSQACREHIYMCVFRRCNLKHNSSWAAEITTSMGRVWPERAGDSPPHTEEKKKMWSVERFVALTYPDLNLNFLKV